MLSIALLIGSIGISLDLHLCQGKVKTYSLIGEAKTCGEMDKNTFCEKAADTPTFTRKKCCTDASLYAKSTVVSEIAISDNTLKKHRSISAYALAVVPSTTLPQLHTNQYKPPPEEWSDRSILLFHQAFLL